MSGYNASEFRPGDVALVTTSNVRSEERLGYRVEALNVGGWQIGVSFCDDSLVTDARRLVVIGVDDDEALGRLWLAYARTTGGTNNMKAALREFANPKAPKPEEPKGLGAVVRCGDDLHAYVRADRCDELAWFGPGGWQAWTDLDVREIEAEGGDR